MILHTLATTPGRDAFDNCLAILSPEDAVVLLGDGVYAGIRKTEACKRLRADALAAGLIERLGPITVVDMEGFVSLTERYPRQLGWY
ncbi:MAG: sulfurtransferase complex subunit TusB [Halioglobus sp.]